MDEIRPNIKGVSEGRTPCDTSEHVLRVDFKLPPEEVGPLPTRVQVADVRRFGRPVVERLRMAGRSPRSYKRPDALILDDLVKALASSYDIDGTELELSCVDGVITASGLLATRAERLQFEALAASTVGVVDYVDHIVVSKGIRPHDEGPAHEDATSKSAPTRPRKHKG